MPAGLSPAGMNRISKPSLRRRWSSIQRSIAVSNTTIASETHAGGKESGALRRYDQDVHLPGRVHRRPDRADRTGDGRQDAASLLDRPWERSISLGLAKTLRRRHSHFFESYYGIPYPGDKLDLLAIPDFASGAMENLGAITFRETALLVDQPSATHGELERVADVVAHENAHMWFGDLVTMSWWNGLWLNEAFATFMEMLAVDAWKPEWKRWDSVRRLARRGLFSRRTAEYETDRISGAGAQGCRRDVRRPDL